MRLVQPPHTSKYEVASSDTIARIALRYNTTPTELSRLNHLSTSLLYPGQTLFVPDKPSEHEKESKAGQNISLLQNTDRESINAIDVPKKNDASTDSEMSFSPDHNLDHLLNNEGLHTSDDEISRKYLKLKSKYVTDGQGVVSGVLLVTPQTVMFNPCVSDHLVVERGREMYVVRLPLRAISRIILFEDIAAMVVGDMSKQYIPKISFIDYASELNISPKPGMIVCQETGETYALHTKLGKNSLSKEQSDKCMLLALQNLSIDQLQTGVFSKENNNGDQSSTDQGISSSDNLTSDSTAKDITITPHTSDPPSLNNNECTGCANFSEFMGDSQFSSTPKHKKLVVEERSTEPLDESTDKMICNTDLSSNTYITDKLSALETNLTTFKDAEKDGSKILEEETIPTNGTINDTPVIYTELPAVITETVEDAKETPLVSIAEANEDSIQNTTTDVNINCDIVGVPVEDSIDDNSSEDKGKCRDKLEECNVDRKDTIERSIDSIADTMIEDHFNITAEDGRGVTSSINSEHLSDKGENTNGVVGTKLGYFENHTSPVFDVSKDSGISEVGSTGLSHQDTNESKEFIHHSLSQGSSLSDEARQWLGKRGVRLSMDKDSESPIPDTSEKIDDEAHDLVTPRPASKVDDPLMYVAIKVHKTYWCPIRAKQNQIMGVPPNRDQKRREHWFAVPKERVDQFYNFLLYWSPDVYGEESSGFSTPCSSEYDNMEEKLNRTDGATGMKIHRSWSLYSVSSKSSTRRTTATTASDIQSEVKSLCEDEIPDLQAESHILSKKQVHLLTRKLPSRTVGHSWELIYSTTIHGISLSTLYRNFQGYDTPVLIVVKDENQKVFGAFMSEVPKISEGFYGTGESLLYTFTSDTTLKTYNWTGENNFFIKGSKSSLVIGGGEGTFGLWLDEDLYRGRSHSCKTFANEKLSDSEDFICCGLEAWGFV